MEQNAAIYQDLDRILVTKEEIAVKGFKDDSVGRQFVEGDVWKRLLKGACPADIDCR